jgi:hypothetical protein
MPNWTDALLIKDKVEVVKRDKWQRIRRAVVPGHNDKYHVDLVRTNGDAAGTIHCFCQREDGKECLGNKESVCYHCLAAILHGIDHSKVAVEWVDNPGDAAEGRIVHVRSNQSGKKVTAVCKPK